MSAWRSVGSLTLLAIALASCRLELGPQRLLIDDLDHRLGTAPTLDSADGVRQLKKERDTGAHEDEARLVRIVSMLKTGTPTSLDLPSVRLSMLANNLGLQVSLLAPEIAAEELRAEQAKFQATFTLSVDQQRTVRPQYFGKSGSVDLTTKSLRIIPGLTVPLRTGGSVNLDWSMSTIENAGGDPGSDSKFALIQPKISLEQPLLRNAGFDYNEASIVLAAANAGAQRGVAQLAVISQLVAAETGYWNLYLAWRTLEINVELYKASRLLLDEARVKVEHHSGSIANVYNFEVALAESVDRVLEAERGLRLAVRRLKVLMQDPDLSLDGSVALQPSTEPRMIAYEFNPHQLVAFALDNRADLLQLEYTLIQRAIDVMVKDNQVLPEFDLRGSWTFNGFDARGRSLGPAYSDLFSGSEPGGWTAGVSASVPIGNKIARSNYRASLLRRLQAIADVRNREIAVTSEVLDAIDTTETRWQQVVTTLFQEQAAQRFFEAYRTLFNRGQIPSSNLTQALQARSSSQVQAARSAAEYQVSLVQLAHSAGCLLGHAGVEWGSYLDKDRLDRSFPSPAAPLPDSFEDTLHQGSPSVETLVPDIEEPQATEPEPRSP